MLKIWKQTWKKDDSARRSQTDGEVGAQGASQSGTSTDVSPQNTLSAAPPNSDDIDLGSVLPRGRRGAAKRARADDSTNPSRPQKKRKAANAESAGFDIDTLGNHLPEVVQAEATVRSGTHVLRAAFEDEVLDQAKSLDTLAVFHSPQASSKTVADYLSWAVDLENSTLESENRRVRRTAVVLTSDLPSVQLQAAGVQSECSLTVGTCTKPILNPSEWSELVSHDIIIVTARTLLESLQAEAVSMSQLHAMVCCDVQNLGSQDSHPLPKIMHDFFYALETSQRPRIFAIYISPHARKFYFDSEILKLENVLGVKVFGISDEKRTEILTRPDRPSEVIALYGPVLKSGESRLFKHLLQLDPTESLFSPHFRAARHAFAQVGSCASDLIWRRALKEIEQNVSPTYEEDEDSHGGSSMSPNRIRSTVRDTVKNWVFSMPNLDPSSRGFNVTPKFAKLVQVLKSCRVYGEEFRGIVFVQKRTIALVILDILRAIDDGLGFLRPHAITGSKKSSETLEDVLGSFAKGTYNLLIATKSTEDLGIPKAFIVIRYDIFESHVSGAFARARTRGRGSHLIHMAERGNDVHRRILSETVHLDAKMQAWTDSVCHDGGNLVPPSGLQESSNPYHSDSDEEEEDYITEPITRGRVYSSDALTIIYRLAASLEHTVDDVDPTLFNYQELPGTSKSHPKYVCTVRLPSIAPLSTVSGPACDSLPAARRAACYQTCQELFSLGLLDYRLFPLPPETHTLHVQPSTALAQPLPLAAPDDDGYRSSIAEIKTSGPQCYPRKKPDFWYSSHDRPLKRLYPMVISTGYSDDSSKPHGPLLIITRHPLPALSDFKLFFSGVPAIMHLTRGASFELDDDQLDDLHLYTIRLCRAIGNKPFECPLDKMQYFFAPLKTTWDASNENRTKWHYPNVFDHIPWDLVTLAAHSWVTPLASSSLRRLTKDVEDAIIQDRWVEFTRRYDVVRMRPDLNPLSKPADSPREEGYANLVDYCKERRKDFDGLQRYDQPLFEVSKIPVVFNNLNPTSRPLSTPTKAPAKYLIPELCAKFTIPASTLRTALLLPSVTRRMEDMLLVKELNTRYFGHSISEQLLHAALSTPASGVEFDYERLELLGDAFLKYLSSIYVFVANPGEKEGFLHVHRQRIISNKSLFQSAYQIGLPQYIQARPFTFKLWRPPNFTVLPNNSANHDSQVIEEMYMDHSTQKRTGGVGHDESNDAPATRTKKPDDVTPSLANNDGSVTDVSGAKQKTNKRKKRADDESTQWLGDKAIADVAEAIIGAAYISGGRETALRVTKALNIPIPNVDRWSDFGRKVLAPPPKIIAKLREGSIQAVETIIGHKFSRPYLLAQALTHSTMQGYETTSYERLEFIGDAILDFMVVRHIYDRDTQLSPGALTLLKGAMVSNSALAAVCVWSGLQQHLLFESHNLADSIQAYVEKLKACQSKEYALAAQEDRSPGQFWLEIEPPKALSDVVESIVGAIYISEDFSPSGAEAIFDNVLKPFYDKHVTLKTLSHHPTKILFELLQAQGCQQFEIVKSKDEGQHLTRCEVIIHEVLLTSATDTTSAFSARRASESALDALEGDADFMTRTCDCRTNALTRQAHKKDFNHMLSRLEQEDEDIMSVEEALVEQDEMISD